MRTIMPVLLLLVTAPAAAAERTYSVTDFDRVQVEGPYEVNLVVGRPSAARASGSQLALDRLSVEVQGRTLKIRYNQFAWGSQARMPAEPVRIDVAARSLRGATLIGSGNLTLSGAQGLKLELGLSGAGRIEARDVQADNLILQLRGSGQALLSGAAKQFRATIQGSGDLDATSLQAEDASLSAATHGSIRVSARRSATVVASGQGEVEILGAKACTISGQTAARVKCGQ